MPELSFLISVSLASPSNGLCFIGLSAAALNFLKNVGGGRCPDKVLRVCIVSGYVLFNGDGEFRDAAKDSTPQAAHGKISEEALHHIEP